YKYQISVLDTCDNESALSIFHKTIHLQISLGIPPAINLSWDDYIGFTSWYYRILRDSTGMGNWEVRDSVDSGTLSWTDPNPPQTPDLSYLVEAVLPAGCTATLMKKGKNYNTSKSNKANKQATGIQDSEVLKTSEVLNAYPNPFTGKTQITYSLSKRSNVILEVFNVLGEKVFSLVNETQNKGKYQYTINTKEEDNDQGVFIVKLVLDNEVYTKLLVAIK
ncbi:MAG: T9SS type A sorting domain-containing protein, partial [Bacteroidetes bacterium]|nr:T9SS type A sorting domain-containing protein [Bacteroidota bacterium]